MPSRWDGLSQLLGADAVLVQRGRCERRANQFAELVVLLSFVGDICQHDVVRERDEKGYRSNMARSLAAWERPVRGAEAALLLRPCGQLGNGIAADMEQESASCLGRRAKDSAVSCNLEHEERQGSLACQRTEDQMPLVIYGPGGSNNSAGNAI